MTDLDVSTREDRHGAFLLFVAVTAVMLAAVVAAFAAQLYAPGAHEWARRVSLLGIGYGLGCMLRGAW